MISNPASAIPPISPVTPRAFDLLEHILDGGPRGPGVGRESLQWRTGVYRLQAVQENADEPNPYLRGARISARTLQLVPVAIDPHHIFPAAAVKRKNCVCPFFPEPTQIIEPASAPLISSAQDPN